MESKLRISFLIGITIEINIGILNHKFPSDTILLNQAGLVTLEFYHLIFQLHTPFMIVGMKRIIIFTPMNHLILKGGI